MFYCINVYFREKKIKFIRGYGQKVILNRGNNVIQIGKKQFYVIFNSALREMKLDKEVGVL